jgi:hypothetical protein
MSRIKNVKHFPAMLLPGWGDFIVISSWWNFVCDFTTKNVQCSTIPYRHLHVALFTDGAVIALAWAALPWTYRGASP